MEYVDNIEPATVERQRETMLLLKALVQGDTDHREGRSLSHTRARARLQKHLDRSE